jgi:hypothetical protein
VLQALTLACVALALPYVLLVLAWAIAADRRR